MWGTVPTIDTSPMAEGAMDLFVGLGQPLLGPLGAIVLFAGVIFALVAAIRSFVT